jgi:hypothetical protein
MANVLQNDTHNLKSGTDMAARRRFGSVLLIAMVLTVAAYGLGRVGIVDWPPHYDPLALPDLNETPYWLTQTRLKLIDVDASNCAVAVSRAGLSATFVPVKRQGTDCALEDAVLVSRLSQARIRSEESRCNIAARLYIWERHVVQPEAQRIFGESVVEITHFGSYSCRTIRGSSYMSEHATGNAFDISGFRLKSGKLISVLNDWHGRSEKSQFLHSVRDGICDYFNLTLSPDYNANHKDHFHVDMGWVRGCR